MGAELTVRQKILVAANSLASDTENFSVEDLIVKTWSLFPESFSLRGYHAQHPDSNRVLAKLSGSDGLCGLGWLEHVDQRMYRVTRKGRVVAKQLAGMQAGTATGPQPAPPPVAAKVSRAPREAAVVEAPAPTPAAPSAPAAPFSHQDVYALNLIAKGDALRKFLRGHALSFADACAFWGISSSSRPAQVQQRLDDTAELLKRAVETFGNEGTPDPRLPSLSTCYGLFNLHRLMLDKFAREVDALRLPLAAG